ncbi:MAG: hypothetical protein JRH11_04300 [Deltaproteobacteria bacterium]|nr:hypothetical protein [Deltaproteobacteria bacterium]
MNRKLGLFLFAGALVASIAASGCVRRARPVNRETNLNTGGGSQGPANVSAEPRQALEQVEAYLGGLGYNRTQAAMHNANLPVNAVIGYAIDPQPNTCYTIVAIAAASSDLNLVVSDAQGQTVAYNVEPDARPWATVCPATTGRHVARLQMVSGGGEYYYAVYQGTPASQPNLQAFYTGAAAGGGRQAAQLDPTTAGRLEQLDQTLSAEGFQRVAEPHGEQFANPDDSMTQLNLQGGSCYAFASLGGPGIRDSDVFLVDGQGNELARDVTPSVDALVRFCPDQTGTYQLRMRLYAGAGPVFTVGYLQQPQGATATGPEPQQPPPPAGNVMATTSTAGVGLDENFRLLDSDMRARGYLPHGNSTRGELGEGRSRDFSVDLEGGKCYAILGVGDNSVRNLDLVLKDSSGVTMDQDVEVDARPVVRVCPEQSGQYTMTVGMNAGSGNFYYAPYRWPRGTRGPFGLAGLIYVRLGEVTSLLATQNYEPDLETAPGQGNIRREGANARHNIELEGGQCYAVLAVGGDGFNNVDLTLSQGNNQIARDSTRSAFPSVRHCPTENGRYRIEVGAAGGSGRYFYQVFRRGGS